MRLSPSATRFDAHRPGEKLTTDLQRSVGNRAVVRLLAGDSAIRRVSAITVANQPLKNTGRMAVAFKALGLFAKDFSGEAWFNNGPEIEAYIKARGKLEGIGHFDGRWLNFAKKGPVVYGEEHNELREDFIKAANIRYRLIEGASERSLTGMADEAIPQHQNSAHRPYGDKDGKAKALENFWPRSAQTLAYSLRPYQQDLEKLEPSEISSSFGPVVLGASRAKEFLEIIRTVRLIEPVEAKGIGSSIQRALKYAKSWLKLACDFGFEELMKAETMPYRPRLMQVRELLTAAHERGGVDRLAFRMDRFIHQMEQVATRQFIANADLDQLDADTATEGSDSALEVWAGRREVFMMKNLEAALAETPQPTIITMGATHAKNQKARIEALLEPHNGTLVISKDITALVEHAALRPW